MSTAQIYIEQVAVTVQVQEYAIKPIKVPMPMGASRWHYSSKLVIILSGSLPILSGQSSYSLFYRKQMYKFKPRRFLGNGHWEGTLVEN